MKERRPAKWISILLAILLMIPLLPGCGEQTSAGPLRILLDVPERTVYNPTGTVFDKLLEEIAEAGGPANVEVEYLPQAGVERETAITRLRTEVMAGEGPDLFIISSNYWSDGDPFECGPLFPFPEKSIVNGLFMPLDKYIEKARFALWSDFNPTVMEVGRTEKGQCLVPLSYTFPVTCFRRFEASHVPSKELTWDDMLADDTQVMRAAVILQGGSETNLIEGMGNPNFDAIFGKTADYKEEKLLFSQEEFEEYTHKQLELYAQENEESLARLPEYFHTYARPWFYTTGDKMGRVPPYIASDEDLTVIPQYNKNGGVTATVFHYACINANSKCGEEAFFVLDYLLSRDGSYTDADGQEVHMLQPSWRQDFYSLFTGSNGLHIDQGMPWFSVHEGAVSQFNRSAMDSAVRCITAVNIHGKLNKMMAYMMSDCQEIASGYQEGNLEELIQETYRVMQMELAES